MLQREIRELFPPLHQTRMRASTLYVHAVREIRQRQLTSTPHPATKMSQQPKYVTNEKQMRIQLRPPHNARTQEKGQAKYLPPQATRVSELPSQGNMYSKVRPCQIQRPTRHRSYGKQFNRPPCPHNAVREPSRIKRSCIRRMSNEQGRDQEVTLPTTKQAIAASVGPVANVSGALGPGAPYRADCYSSPYPYCSTCERTRGACGPFGVPHSPAGDT